MNKIDRFFKNKLEGFVLEPGSGAWAKLDVNLSKKNKRLVWFRAAALLLMGLFIATIVWWQSSEENQQQAEHLKIVTPPEVSSKSKLKEGSITQSTSREEDNMDRKGNSNSFTNKTTKPRPLIMEEDELETIKLETPSTETVATITAKEKPIVIEYTLETILPQKPETPGIAEIDEKKTSLQKALEFARDAKNSDSPLGGIRQAKDDLFALNFKKDKQKKQ